MPGTSRRRHSTPLARSNVRPSTLVPSERWARYPEPSVEIPTNGRAKRISAPSLRHRAGCQLASADAIGEAQIVLDHRGRTGLAARRDGLYDQGAEALRC